MKSIVVVLPASNEAKYIERCIRLVWQVVENLGGKR